MTVVTVDSGGVLVDTNRARLELDALASELESVAERIEADACQHGLPDAGARRSGCPEVAMAVDERAAAARQAARAMRLGALAARHLRRRSDELDDALRRQEQNR